MHPAHLSSRVPVHVWGSSGVNTIWFRRLTTRMLNSFGSMSRARRVPAHPVPTITSVFLRGSVGTVCEQ